MNCHSVYLVRYGLSSVSKILDKLKVLNENLNLKFKIRLIKHEFIHTENVLLSFITNEFRAILPKNKKILNHIVILEMDQILYKIKNPYFTVWPKRLTQISPLSNRIILCSIDCSLNFDSYLLLGLLDSLSYKTCFIFPMYQKNDKKCHINHFFLEKMMIRKVEKGSFLVVFFFPYALGNILLGYNNKLFVNTLYCLGSIPNNLPFVITFAELKLMGSLCRYNPLVAHHNQFKNIFINKLIVVLLKNKLALYSSDNCLIEENIFRAESAGSMTKKTFCKLLYKQIAYSVPMLFRKNLIIFDCILIQSNLNMLMGKL
ncbi:hypothetical protein BpHYR1_041543 [Brachionus plicatilis]|uniref:Uncharacterized protein n=1 Tax=Brachionus plicatilis TaxID=10195 RepID=A0A3M7QGB8_BRAPC|nr:hypothetical protein BpHYR1_041543 [Brachionus plicatilis]